MNNLARGLILLALAPAVTQAAAWVRWQVPQSGAPASAYVVQLRDLEGDLDQTILVPAMPGIQQSYAFDGVQYMHRYQARIAAQDSQGRQGPWTDWTAIYDRELPLPQP